ncbi:aminopeptidase m1 [Quercus suber]|uniref:Aminopeptidase m1 n=1 Tax=Quercus suber TaxID=58331 RepID=A0AAW0KBK1_QUESU
MVSYLAADRLFLEWKVWTQFLDEYTKGLEMDGLRESHPIEVKINHASEIDEIIDSISYIKGAFVIQMLQSYLGADCFQRSLASYVKKFACLNAKTKDLWAALEEGSSEPVNKLMNSWTKQKGTQSSLSKSKIRNWMFEQMSYKVERITADAALESPVDIKFFFINLFLHSVMKLGWEPKPGESHLDAMLRGEVLTALAMFGHNLTLEEASRRFLAFLDDRNTPLLHPDIRKAVYVAVMRRVSTSNRFGYESLLRVYRETNLSQEEARILSSLTSSPDPNITLEALNILLSSEVRTQDAVLGLAVSREGRETAWTWLKFASSEKAEEIQEFFASRTNFKIARTLKQSIERVHINAYCVQSYRIEVQNELARAFMEII